MTNSRALIGLIVDRSGSMEDCQTEMQNAINEFLKDQGSQEYEADASLADFDVEYTLRYAPTPIQDIPEYTLQPRYGTALYDAIGRFIKDLGNDLKKRPESQRPGKVLIAIVTDGMENSSTQFRGENGRRAIQKMVEHQRDKYNWDFVFLGANIDATEVGMGLGVARGSTLTFDVANAPLAMASMSNYATAYNSSSLVGAAAAPGFTEEDRKSAMVTPSGGSKE